MTKWQSLDSVKARCETGCGLPAGFFRLRYFHGKTLRLADYVDEQRYHQGKMRFHNDRLHGAGILCGLRVAALDRTLLRVSRGAALDDCGREIVVGHDQCIDVEGWFRQQKMVVRDGAHNPCVPDRERRVRLCVVLRYAECSSAPEPAPASACGPATDCGCGCGGGGDCGSGGCADPCGGGAEYGRVSEDFDLRLMFHDEARALTGHELFPTREAIADAVREASGGVALLQALGRKVRSGCPASDEDWLMLACFDLVLDKDDDSRIDRIGAVDYDCASQPLLSAEVIQHLLANLYAAVDPDIGGPEIASVSFRRLDAKHYQLALGLKGQIDADSLDPDDSLGLRRLVPGGWDHPPANAVRADYSAVATGDFLIAGPAIYLTLATADGFIAEGGRYHLFVPASSDPIVDPQLRPLRPRALTLRFALTKDAGTGDLAMALL